MVITLAPLLGLLGTVTGMMGSFSLIGGELSTPGAITGGIAEALIATAFGLGIAITALIPFNLLNSRREKASLEIESAATQLLLMQPHKNAIKAQRTQGQLSRTFKSGDLAGKRELIRPSGQPEKERCPIGLFPKRTITMKESKIADSRLQTSSIAPISFGLWNNLFMPFRRHGRLR